MCISHHVEAARAALARAAWARGAAPTYDEDAVSDLLTDIRHLCALAGHDFERCSRVAAMYFNDENGGASRRAPSQKPTGARASCAQPAGSLARRSDGQSAPRTA